jgi:hypothetical protein
MSDNFRKSIGISIPTKINFINSTTIIYSSGSALVTADIQDFSKKSKTFNETSGSKDELVDTEAIIHNKHSYIPNATVFASAESNISALATNQREPVVAYSEMDSLEIIICQWPTKSKVGPKGFVMGMLTTVKCS